MGTVANSAAATRTEINPRVRVYPTTLRQECTLSAVGASGTGRRWAHQYSGRRQFVLSWGRSFLHSKKELVVRRNMQTVG